VRQTGDRRGSPADHLLSRSYVRSRHRNARGMGYSRALRDDVSAHRRVVKRLINSSVETIAVVADGDCFCELEAYDLWETRDTTGGPPDVVDLHHMAHLSPGSHTYPGGEDGGFNLQPVTVELLVSEKFRRQDRLIASYTGIMDLP